MCASLVGDFVVLHPPGRWTYPEPPLTSTHRIRARDPSIAEDTTQLRISRYVCRPASQPRMISAMVCWERLQPRPLLGSRNVVGGKGRYRGVQVPVG